MSLIVRNTLYSSADSVVLMVLAFLNISILTSSYGVAGFGVYSLLIIFSVYGSLVAFDLGIEATVIHRIARFMNEKVRDLSAARETYITATFTLFGLGALVGLATFCLLYFSTEIFVAGDELASSMVRSSAVFVSTAIPLQFGAMAANGVLLGLEKYFIAKLLNSLNLVANSCTIVYCAWLNMHLSDIFQIYLYISILRFVALQAVIYREIDVTKTKAFSLIRASIELLRESRVLFFSRITGLIFNYTDRIVISTVMGPTSLGFYEILKRLVIPVQLLNTVLVSAILPAVTRLLANDNWAAAKNTLQAITTVATYFISFLISATFLLVDPFVDLWLSDVELPQGFSDWVAIPLIWIFINIVPSIINTVALALGKVRETLIYGGIGALINLVATILIIQAYGIVGVLFATLAAHSVIAVFYYRLVFYENLLSLKSLAKTTARALTFMFFSICIGSYFLDPAGLFQWMASTLSILLILAVFLFRRDFYFAFLVLMKKTT